LSLSKGRPFDKLRTPPAFHYSFWIPAFAGMTDVRRTRGLVVIPAEAGIRQKSQLGFAGLKDERDEEKAAESR